MAKRFRSGSSGVRKRTRFAFKKSTKRAYRAKRKGVTRNKSTVKAGLGFPKKMVMTHKYHETVSFGIGGGVLGTYTFSCNGMYDPNITGTGHQPLYFDQMTALYDHYTVIGSKIRVKLCQGAANQPTVKIATFINDDGTVTPTSIDMMGEQSCGKQFIIPPASTDTYTITNKWSAKKTFGGSPLSNDLLQGTVAANPTEQSFYTFGFQAADLTTTVAMFAEVDITYIAVWDELKDIAGS